MERVLFLNELSVADEVIPLQAARGMALNLLAVIRSARHCSGAIGLNCSQRLVDHPLDPEKTIKQVFQGDDFRDEWRFLKTLVDRSPFREGLSVLSDPDRIDYIWQGRAALGLGWAHLMDSLSVSLDAKEYWKAREVELTREMLNDDASITTDTVTVRNASCLEHIDHWRSWLSETANLSGVRPTEVWEARAEYFPKLQMLDRVEGDLVRLHAGGVAYGAALALLQTLNADISRWEGEGYPTFSTKVTPEGQTRRQLCMYPDLSGEVVCFDLHARFTGGIPGRLHFRLDGPASKATVAYIGPKLDAPIGP